LAVPRELWVKDVAEQFVNLLRIKETPESCKETVLKMAIPRELRGPTAFIMLMPTTTATAPPVACTRITSVHKAITAKTSHQSLTLDLKPCHQL
jgi:hypothetical protein